MHELAGLFRSLTVAAPTGKPPTGKDKGLQPLVQERMRDYFTRQTEWFERLLAEGERACESGVVPLPDGRGSDAKLDTLLERQRAQTAEMIQFEREMRILVGEWKTAGNISALDREAVARLAEQVEELAQRVAESNNEALQRARARLEELRCAWGEVRKGREALNKYRGHIPPDARFMDKKA